MVSIHFNLIMVFSVVSGVGFILENINILAPGLALIIKISICISNNIFHWEIKIGLSF